jgi:hypothetical protein
MSRDHRLRRSHRKSARRAVLATIAQAAVPLASSLREFACRCQHLVTTFRNLHG